MGLITKTVKIFWRYYNREEYENKGYEFTGIGHLFEIKIEDLFKTSKRIVECECDKCGKEIKMKYIDYNKKSTEDGQIFCEDCEPYYIDNGNNKKFSGIYKIENLVNGKVYIGQSNDVKRRWKEHKRCMTNKKEKDRPFYRAIIKYGIGNFSFKVLTECSLDDLNELEEYYIDIYNSYIHAKDSNGYNQTVGGDGFRGLKLTEERKAYLSKIHTGMHVGGKNHAAKIVYCEGKRYECIKDCAEYYNVGPSAMRSWLNKERPMPKEFHDKQLHCLNETMDDYEIQKENVGENHVKSIPVYCEGKKFANVNECAKYYNINRGTMNSWLKGCNNMPQEWYDKGLHREGKYMSEYKVQTGVLYGKDNPSAKCVYCDGIKYDTCREFANKNNLFYTTVMNWLNKNTPMPQEWYDKKLHLEGEDMSEYKVQTKRIKNKKR